MKWIKPFGARTENERYRNAEPTVAGSNPDAAFFNTVLDELLGIIAAADMSPDDSNNQVATAIVALTERAATSGVIRGSYWFAKTKSTTTVPNPTMAGQNYIDFTTLKTYVSNNGTSWTQSGTLNKPAGIDFTVLITSKIWDIPEQSGQQGGWATYSHTDNTWGWWPKIISFENAALTGIPTTPNLTQSSPGNQVVPKGYVDGKLGLATTSTPGIVQLGNTDNTANAAQNMVRTTVITTSIPSASSASNGTIYFVY